VGVGVEVVMAEGAFLMQTNRVYFQRSTKSTFAAAADLLFPNCGKPMRFTCRTNGTHGTHAGVGGGMRQPVPYHTTWPQTMCLQTCTSS
jgi:hypothetical protein